MWAHAVAELAFSTIAGSPRSERMRSALLSSTFEILKEHYDQNMTLEEYREIVFEKMRDLDKEAEQPSPAGWERPQKVEAYFLAPSSLTTKIPCPICSNQFLTSRLEKIGDNLECPNCKGKFSR